MTAHSTLPRPADSNPCIPMHSPCIPVDGPGVDLDAIADELLLATETDGPAADDALPAAIPSDGRSPADQVEDAQDAALLAGSQIMQWSRAGLTGAPAPSGSTAELLPDGAWQAEATCRTASPAEAEIFTGSRSQTEASAVVQDHCDGCPVRLACLAGGRLLRGWGVFGGVVLIDGRRAARERPGSRQDTSSRPPSRYPSEARRSPVPSDQIRAFLADELAGGPLSRQDVLATADTVGIAPSSAMKAARRMKLVSTRVPGTNAVLWSLPDVDWTERSVYGPAPAPLENVALWLIDALADTGPIFPGAVVSDAPYPAERLYEAAALLDLPPTTWSAL